MEIEEGDASESYKGVAMKGGWWLSLAMFVGTNTHDHLESSRDTNPYLELYHNIPNFVFSLYAYFESFVKFWRVE